MITPGSGELKAGYNGWIAEPTKSGAGGRLSKGLNNIAMTKKKVAVENRTSSLLKCFNKLTKGNNGRIYLKM
jgi:hypothetical protein